MSKIQHPIRDQTFSYYELIDSGGAVPEDRNYVAFFSSPQEYPMYFHGSTFEEVRDRAVAFQNSSADANEKKYLIRVEAMRKARLRKKDKV